jgi:type IV secretory pathway VirB6-like protein
MEVSLIDYGGQTLVLILSFVLIFGTVMTVGYISHNLENAITFTILSVAPLFLAFMLFHS